jgi:hypothetical protein
MGRQKSRSQKLQFAKNMPALYHTQPGKKYNWKDSDVLKWLAARPALIEYLFETVKNKEIIYDSETGKWQGVDYAD